ncbi:MAG TPA: hypothetical protein PL033_05420 [Candidatus Brocadiia bacterium]|nr:hypothetical protein [Candidatus Brocadiia bacterium]
MIRKRILLSAIALFCATAAYRAEARIKLVALPPRQTTVVRLDNPQFTLVEEERALALQKGENQVDFSWKGVSIDPDSIRLRILGHEKEVRLISVSYPPGEAALVWQIYSDIAVEEPVRISYLLSNIDRLVTYKAVAEQDESKMDLSSYLILRNFSGEDFENAKVLLDYGQAYDRSIDHEETKQLLFFTARGLPIEKTFTWDSETMPWDPDKTAQNVGIPVYYAIENSAKNPDLGKNALWGGKARVYQKDTQGSTIFAGEDNAAYTPVGEKVKLYIGQSRDVVVTRKKMRENQIEVKRNKQNQVIMYDTDELVEIEIENFKDKPAVLVLTEHIPEQGPFAATRYGRGEPVCQWDMEECSHKYEVKDAGTLEFRIELTPRSKQKLVMHYHRRNLR